MFPWYSGLTIVWVASAADVDLVVEVRATLAIEDRLDWEGEFVGQIPSLDHIKGWEVGEEEAQVFRVASELLLEHRALRNLYERGTSDLGALAVGALATGCGDVAVEGWVLWVVLGDGGM